MFLLNLTEILKKFFNIKSDYIILIIYTLIIYITYKLSIKVFAYITKKMNLDERLIYTANQRNKTLLSILLFLVLIYIWHEQLKEIITLISFISAAITLAARDIIFNYFCGLFIKIKKPIKVEDRIKVNDILGDVISINALNTEILEVNADNNQSTGIIINVPNSVIFNNATKNYNSVFKYIWDELVIKVSIDTDIQKAKDILFDILKSEETIKDIPKKMKRELAKNSADYHIYYNNLTPIIYTKIVDDGIILNVRFLIHPKKQRNIESNIYEQILDRFRKENIILK